MTANPLVALLRSTRTLPGITFLALALSIGSATSSAMAQEGPSERELVLIEIAREFSNSDSPSDWVGERQEWFSPEFRAELEQLADRAAAGGALGTSLAVRRMLALRAILAEDRRESAEQLLKVAEIDFKLANTSEAYEAVRSSALSLADSVEAYQDADLAFRFWLIAADSSYFATLLDGIPHDARQLWETRLMDDLLATATRAEVEDNEIWFERFVSLAATASSEISSQLFYGGNEDRRLAILAKLTPEFEAAIPIDFSYRHLPNKTLNDEAALARVLARLSYDFGNAGLASARLQRAAGLVLAEDDLESWTSLMSQRYAGERDNGAAAAHLDRMRRAIRATMKEVRSRYRSRAGRLWAAERAQTILGEMLRDELEGGNISPDVAFREIEALKARYLLDQLAVPFSLPTPPSAAETARRLERLVLSFPECLRDQAGDDISLRELLLVSHVPLGPPMMERGQQLRTILELERIYEKGRAGFEGVAPLADLSPVQSELGKGEAILEYFIPYHELHPAMGLWVLAIANDKAKLIKVPLTERLPAVLGPTGRLSVGNCPPLDTSPLGDAIAALRIHIQESDENRALSGLDFFYDLLVRPLAEAGFEPERFERWIIVPHGPLHYLPFAALRSPDRRFLIEDLALTVVPSASVWMYQQQHERQWPTTALGIFAPQLNDPSLPPLPGAAAERQAVAGAFPGPDVHWLEGPEARESAFVQLSPRAELVHISTHGYFPERDAIDFHQLLLTTSEDSDGRLHAHEIRSVDLRKAAVVVLAVCNGGLYNSGPSDEPYGLIPAFVASGADTVVGTLWPLEDAFGRDFLSRMYQSLPETGVADALRATAQFYIEEEELIRRWAGFVSVGPGRAWTP